jgi:outer membrane protein assembly factor BamB
MAKTAADFLSDLAERELVPERILSSLRRQVAAATRPVSAATVAKLLVEKGHLTTVQAERLLGTPLKPAVGGPPVAASTASLSPAEPNRLPPPSLTETKPMELNELGLAPLEEAPRAPSKASPPVRPVTEALEPLDLELLGLMPLDDAPAPASPKPAATGQLGPVPQKSAARFKPPSSPAKKPAAPGAPSAFSPLTELQPLEPLPLDALAPLPSPPAAAPQPARTSTPARAARAAPASAATVSPETPAAVATALPAAPPAAAKPAAPPADRSRIGRWLVAIAAGLVLFVVAGGIAAWLLLPRGADDKEWQLAQQAYQEKRYAAAVEKYTALLKSDPRHPQAPLARVRLSVARILAAKGTGDWSAALPVAREVLAEIDHEPQLAEVHAELAPQLTEMAEALVKQAGSANADHAAERLAAAKDALALANNGRYVPGKLRAWQRLADAEETLAALARKQACAAATEKFIDAADKSVAAGDLKKLHAERAKLLAEYPELAEDGYLHEVGQHAAKAAAAGVQPAAELNQGSTDERPRPVVASMMLTHRPAAAAAGPAGMFAARAGSSVWALDAASGKILWRRPVGSTATIDPVRLPAGGGVLLVDARHHELLCVDERSGALRWRHSLDAPIAGPPLPRGDKILLTTSAGLATALSAASGNAVAAAGLPSAACSGPATDDFGRRIYQLADRDYLFVLSPDDLKCHTAIYMGHLAACVDIPPLVVGGRLLVAENRGVDRALLHVVPLDESGLPEGHVQQVELPGHVFTPPVVVAGRLLVLTDLGTVAAFEIPAKSDEPLAKIAESPLESAGCWLRFGIAVGNQFFLADLGLKQTDFAPAGGSLKAKWTAFQDDVFQSPPQVAGDVLLAVRRPAGDTGWIAAAVKASDGQPLWETPLAVPLVELSALNAMAHVVSASGAAAQVPLSDIAGDKSHELLPLVADGKRPSIAATFLLAGGRRVLVPAGQPRELLLIDADGKSLRSIAIPDALAGLPVAAAGGLIVPCAGGTVYWLNAEGVFAAAPFQMSMQAGTRLERCSCTAIGDSGDRVLISDGRGALYLLAVEQSPEPQWKLVATSNLDTPPISPVAALGEHVFLVTRGGSLLSLSLPELKPDGTQPLDAHAVEFGPEHVGDMLLAATDRQELVSIGGDGSIRWRVSLEESVTGRPVVSAGSLIVATAEGALVRLAADSGKELARVELGERLRGSPLVVGSDVLVATADGVLLKVALPSKQEPTP